MKIVALDGHPLNPGDNPWTPIEQLGDLTVYPRTDSKNIATRAAGAEIIITNKVPLSGKLIQTLDTLQFIAVTATGYDIIDTKTAASRNIPVSNVPGYSSDAVAQHTIALLLETTNRVGLHNDAVKEGEWTTCPDFSFTKSPLMELTGKTLGIIGFGDIGRRVARIASALGMRIIAHSRTQRATPPGLSMSWTNLEDLLSQSDVISLHCPQTPETTGIINKTHLQKVKPGAILINTARGGLIVEEDLAAALHSGPLAAAALDVVSQEPIPRNSVLLSCPNCLITPHLAWATLEARKRLMQATADNIASFQKGRPVNTVNL